MDKGQWQARRAMVLGICWALLAAPGCRKSPDPGMHTTEPEGGGDVHVCLRQPQPDLQGHKEVWFNNVELMMFTNTGASKILSDETNTPVCFDPADPDEECVRVQWKDLKRIEWSEGRLVATLRTNGYRMHMFTARPSDEARTMRIRYERIVHLGGGYKVRRTTEEKTFNLANVQYVEIDVN